MPWHLIKHVVTALLTILAVLGFALAIAQDQVTLRIDSTVAARDPAFPAYVGTLIGAPISTGNEFEVLENGDQIFPAMLQAIQAARRQIDFESYIYTDGEVADRFNSALDEAARRGVDVKFTVDAIGSKKLSNDTLRRLRDGGCQIALFNAPSWYTLEAVNYRTHRKILVADGAVAFTGGVGVADYWAGHAQDEKHWRDTQFRIAGPAARYLEGAFYDNFTEASDEARRDVKPMLPAAPPLPGEPDQTMVVWSQPTGGANGMKMLYLLSLSAARTSIDIISPYFILDESTGRAIDLAAKRGVRVRLLVEGDQTDAKSVKYASRQAYDGLLAEGVRIYEYQGTMMHTKAMVIDGVWSIVGSANFDNRSLELNDELNVATRSESLGSRILQMMERDLTHARELRLDDWRKRGRLEKSREYVWSFFGELF